METATTYKTGYTRNPNIHVYGGSYGGDYTVNDAYNRGKKDGAKDKEIELIKRGNALFQLAIQKAESITHKLAESAKSNQITIYEFHLKVDNWDCIQSLIVVDMDDFIDDKIEELYKAASEISDEINDDIFHWEYSITYASDDLDTDKIISDGFTHSYEHTNRPRKTQ